jgi:hypothetical protein
LRKAARGLNAVAIRATSVGLIGRLPSEGRPRDQAH